MFQKQAIMARVLYSLIPLSLFAIYQYGLRFSAVAAVVFVVGVLVEYAMERGRGKKPSQAVLASCALFTLSLPPAVPLWIAAVGIAFGVFMAKEVYGGFGRNVFNPAIAGRLFVYIAFATVMQHSFVEPGGFGLDLDAVSGPTPLAALRAGEELGLIELFFGFHRASMGEGSIILIAVGAIYLLITKTANWRLMLSTIASAVVAAFALWLAGIKGALPPQALLAGSFFFVAVFMATDPVTAPKKPMAQWLYGLLIGGGVVLLRTFSLFPEGTSFAVLLGNSASCLLDTLRTKKRRPRMAKENNGGSI